ncbi:MAG: hypothetical protein DMF74_19260 [Acidobacteria bacterium]|nr:MAG: hypothetical protein DMF74_19260 [Acidobacteriota bacterium]
MQRMIDLSNNRAKYVAVHVAELYEAWRLGLISFTQELQTDSARSSRVLTKANHFFSEWGVESVEELISAMNE